MLFRLGNITYLWDVTPSSPLPFTHSTLCYLSSKIQATMSVTDCRVTELICDHSGYLSYSTVTQYMSPMYFIVFVDGSLVLRPPPFLPFICVHTKSGSSTSTYCCDHKRTIKTKKAWEQGYVNASN